MINNLTGKVTLRMQSGSFFFNDLISDLYTVDKTLHTLRMSAANGEDVRIKTRDGSDVRLDVEVNYSLLMDEKTILSKVLDESGVKTFPVERGQVFGKGGETPHEEAYERKWIRDYSRSIVRQVFGELLTNDFYDAGKRDAKARQTETALNKLLQPHGIEVAKVVPDTFTFYEEYESLIKAKKAADQEVDKQKQDKLTAESEQKKRVAEAEAALKVEVATIKGKLERDQIEAQGEAIKAKKAAEAYSYETKVGADASFYQAERQAKGILAKAKSEATALQNLVKALAGEGGRKLVLRQIAEALRKARIEGLPYATNATIQKVTVDAAAATKGRK